MQAKADEIARLMNENEQLKLTIEDLKVGMELDALCSLAINPTRKTFICDGKMPSVGICGKIVNCDFLTAEVWIGVCIVMFLIVHIFTSYDRNSANLETYHGSKLLMAKPKPIKLFAVSLP